ncbi:Shugoshin-1 [Dichanthelium oligosanthes]|uniref:Shugoshin-1 n=1 Tax=Dichanthelium oligosanthes TaxID=888268 RepID=A0A1E5W6Y7_9POAL|nr:Shugoshin-1 [Dichanthelium oligosanthes]
MASAAAAARGAAVGGPNPSGDAGPKLRSPPGKASKPVALADITNTGRPNASRSISVADVVKENGKLLHLLTEKSKIIELSRVEINKLHLALQASRQQNLQLAQTNSQMLAQKNKTANQGWKEVNSQEVLNAIPSKVATADAHRIHGSVTSSVEHQLVESQSAVPSNSVCQEPPQDATKKRGRNKRKSESSECIKDANIMQEHYRPHLQPIMSLDHEDPRKPQRRRSSRLNQVLCEVAEVSDKTLRDDTVVPSAPSTEKDMGRSLQNECSAIVHEVLMSSEVEETEINKQPQKESNLKEIQEACSQAAGVEAQIDVTTSNSNLSHLASQSSVPFNIIEAPKPPEETGIKRSSNKQKLALCGSGKAVEDATTSEPLRQEKKRKSQRRTSARLNSVSSEDKDNISEALHEDVIAPLASTSLNASLEQRTNLKQNDSCLSMKSTEGHVAGRRSLRRAAEKVVSYKEIPLNVKMRRP